MNKIFKIITSSVLTIGFISSCGGSPSNPTTSTDPTTSSDPTTSIDPSLHEGITLDYFILVNDTKNTEVATAISYAASKVEALYGTSFVELSKADHTQRYEYEIVVGNIYEGETTGHYSNLYEGDLVIKNVVTDTKITYYIGGTNDYYTSIALYEFADSIADGTIFEGDRLSYNYNKSSNINEIYFSDEEIKEFEFVTNSNLKSKTKETMDLFIRDFNKYLGVSKTQKYDTYGTSSSNSYQNHFIVDMINEDSFDLISTLGTNEFRVKSIRNGDNFNIHLTGVSDQITIHAIQNFYTEVVVNGNLNIPKYIELGASPVSRRDPCIVPYEGVYYLYTSNGTGYQVEKSTDLKYWSDETQIFDASWDSSFDGYADYWAPECHYYNGKFYLFATYKSRVNEHRGCAIWVSDTPDGKFELLTDNHITPNDWDAIDGTLYVDKEGTPYMVFVHEWTSTDDGIGRMCYAKLTDDLKEFAEEPVEIFRADDPVWSNQCVTDGCYMYRTSDGELLMIWSNFASKGFSNYTIGIAKSDNGEIDGNWIQQEEVLHTNDNNTVFSVFNGGHGMIFEGFDGKTYITFHAPNNAGEWLTMVMYVPIREENGTIVMDLIK